MNNRSFQGGAPLAAVLDALPDGIVLIDRNGIVVGANDAAHDMFGVPGTPLVGHGLRGLLPDHGSRTAAGAPRDTDDRTVRRRRGAPLRMTARRLDGGEFPSEVTTTVLGDGSEPFLGGGSEPHGPGRGRSDDESMLLLVVRDLTDAHDAEAALVRSQRRTEVILRAATEGLIGTDTEGRVVLVNPAAARILGFRASDLDGRELHPLVLHSRANGEPNPYVETPLAATLVSGLKCRAHDQVLWTKDGGRVSADVTTIPVWDGDRLVGTIMAFTDRGPVEKLIGEHAAEMARQNEKYDALDERHQRLESAFAALREQLRRERAGGTGAAAPVKSVGAEVPVGSVGGMAPAEGVGGMAPAEGVGGMAPARNAAVPGAVVAALARRPSPVPAPVPAREDVSSRISPVAGSWIIGAAVRARREQRASEQQSRAALPGPPPGNAFLRAVPADEAVPRIPRVPRVPQGVPADPALTPRGAHRDEEDGAGRKRLSVLLTNIRNRPS
ncbi:PAS domain-containing protein [Streptomyces sp. NPDC006435]|uniref:PAS domain-containing protein n=1 Tax=Streptomyces sp. NPDC006435 TaxID=3154300 RepID=UPI0033AC0239